MWNMLIRYLRFFKYLGTCTGKLLFFKIDLIEKLYKFLFCSYCDIEQILYCQNSGNTTYCRKPLNYKGK